VAPEVKVELFFKYGFRSHVSLTIEGEPEKVRELVNTIEEKVKQWKDWEEE
jgi:hypothetical protein